MMLASLKRIKEGIEELKRLESPIPRKGKHLQHLQATARKQKGHHIHHIRHKHSTGKARQLKKLKMVGGAINGEISRNEEAADAA